MIVHGTIPYEEWYNYVMIHQVIIAWACYRMRVYVKDDGNFTGHYSLSLS